VVLIGAGLASYWQRARWRIWPALQPLNHAPRWLLLLGTWPLTVYLLHQPILLGIMAAARQLGL
jgi:uncharacterized membrane protein